MWNCIITGWIFLVLLGQTTQLVPESLSDGAPQISVISTSAPQYPPSALLTRTKGTVFVDLIIDSEGKVVSAKAVVGPPLLRYSAEAAARLWRFQTVASDINNRHAQLAFIFDIVFDESTQTKDEGSFIPPSKFALTRRIATISPLSRVAGRLSEERCPLHGEKLKLDVVPIMYGLPAAELRHNNVDIVSLMHNAWRKLTYRESYFEAERVRFPKSQKQAYGGCMAGDERKAEVLYCQRCRDIETKWRKKHPKSRPGMMAVISGRQ